MFEREKPMQACAVWKCSGCGALTPDRVRACDCPTAYLYREIDGVMEHHVKTDVEQYPFPRGIGRVSDNAQVLIVFFDREPTDDEMRAVHDALREMQHG